eukprot:2919658-Pyramimonas_sp.AAC.1
MSCSLRYCQKLRRGLQQKVHFTLALVHTIQQCGIALHSRIQEVALRASAAGGTRVCIGRLKGIDLKSGHRYTHKYRQKRLRRYGCQLFTSRTPHATRVFSVKSLF